MRISKRLKFHGLVQGVNFRRQTQVAALGNHVDGWIRNMSDGSVEALFSGEQEAVYELIQFCLHELRGAEVSSYEITDSDEPGKPSFQVL